MTASQRAGFEKLLSLNHTVHSIKAAESNSAQLESPLKIRTAISNSFDIENLYLFKKNSMIDNRNSRITWRTFKVTVIVNRFANTACALKECTPGTSDILNPREGTDKMGRSTRNWAEPS